MVSAGEETPSSRGLRLLGGDAVSALRLKTESGGEELPGRGWAPRHRGPGSERRSSLFCRDIETWPRRSSRSGPCAELSSRNLRVDEKHAGRRATVTSSGTHSKQEMPEFPL